MPQKYFHTGTGVGVKVSLTFFRTKQEKNGVTARRPFWEPVYNQQIGIYISIICHQGSGQVNAQHMK